MISSKIQFRLKPVLITQIKHWFFSSFCVFCVPIQLIRKMQEILMWQKFRLNPPPFENVSKNLSSCARNGVQIKTKTKTKTPLHHKKWTRIGTLGWDDNITKQAVRGSPQGEGKRPRNTWKTLSPQGKGKRPRNTGKTLRQRRKQLDTNAKTLTN